MILFVHDFGSSIKTMLIVFILFIVVLVSAIFYIKHRLETVQDKDDLASTVDHELGKFIKKDAQHGVIVGIYKNGRLFTKAYGTIEPNNKQPPTNTTLFQIASITKVFTASLLQILVDEGVVELDATLGELLGETTPLSPTVTQVTLRQLATHTSGFEPVPKPLLDKVITIVGKKNILHNPYQHLSEKDIFDYLATTDYTPKPGKFRYSNFGMGLLGHVLEKVTHQSLETLMKEKILLPLNMQHTAITLSPGLQQQLAPGFKENGSATPIWTFQSLAGAGGLFSNMEDMMIFLQANIEHHSPLFESLQKTHVQQFDGETGLGWMLPTFLDRIFGNKTIIWHNGLVGGYASYLSIDKQTNTGVIVLSNKGMGMTMLGMMLTRQARTQSWAAE